MSGKPLPKLGDRATLLCNLFPLEIWLPIFGPTYAAINDKPISGIGITFQPVSITVGPGMAEVPRYGKVQVEIAALVFLRFYEENLSLIVEAFGGRDRTQWPQLFQFAWAVRNAITHNAGRISFQRANASPVCWYSLSYSPSDNGRLILGPALGFGDLLVLMFEMADELDQRGCSTPPSFF
jgi:hypothetical protein